MRVGTLPLGLIPAHAGKTLSDEGEASSRWAHPRSRGENPTLGTHKRHPPGSSPLTRGKLNDGHFQKRRVRLIPAHAGKTTFVPICVLVRRAHPRSREENSANS